jgi:hypothetical protein
MLDLPPAPTTTTPKPGGSRDSCTNSCWVNDQVASCESRVRWAAKYTYKDKPDACSRALTLVQSQCPGEGGCSGCPVNGTGCVDARTYASPSKGGGSAAANDHKEEETQTSAPDASGARPPYNCTELEQDGVSKGRKEEVEEARRITWWCCTHERKLCGDQAIFKRKFVSRGTPAATIPEGTKAKPRGTWMPSRVSWPITGLKGLSVAQAALACGSLLFVLAAPLLGLLAIRRRQAQAQVAVYREFRRNAAYNESSAPEFTQVSLLAELDNGMD